MGQREFIRLEERILLLGHGGEGLEEDQGMLQYRLILEIDQHVKAALAPMDDILEIRFVVSGLGHFSAPGKRKAPVKGLETALDRSLLEKAPGEGRYIGSADNRSLCLSYEIFQHTDSLPAGGFGGSTEGRIALLTSLRQMTSLGRLL